MYRQLSTALAALAAGALWACSGTGAPATPNIQNPVTQMTRRAGPDASVALVYACYRNHDQCVWFERGHARVKGIISGLEDPAAIAVDRGGNVYIALGFFGTSDVVQVYPRGSTSLLRTLDDSGSTPDGVAVDANGTVYVANAYGSSGPDIAIYAGGSTTITSTISDPDFHYVNSVAVDEHHELLACFYNQSFVRECKEYPNASLPGKVVFRGMEVFDLAFDTAGNVALATKYGTKYLTPGFKPCGFDGSAKVFGIAFDSGSGDIFKTQPNGDIDEEAYTSCSGGSVEHVYNTGTFDGNHADSITVDPGNGV